LLAFYAGWCIFVASCIDSGTHCPQTDHTEINRLKRIVVIAVLFIFLVNTMGYYFVFQCSQYRVKQEMISQIRMGLFHPNIILLKILSAEKDRQFQRLEKNEFTWYGKRYDIVVERKSGDTTLFYCLHDKKEETLLADFTLFFLRSGRSGSSSKDSPIHALLHNLVTQALIQSPTLPAQSQGIKFIFPVFQTSILPVYLVHFAPPPEIA
jgi:hypothetical protein